MIHTAHKQTSWQQNLKMCTVRQEQLNLQYHNVDSLYIKDSNGVSQSLNLKSKCLPFLAVHYTLTDLEVYCHEVCLCAVWIIINGNFCYILYIFRDSKMWEGLVLHMQRDRYQLSPAWNEKRALCTTLTSSNVYPYCMASVVLSFHCYTLMTTEVFPQYTVA